VADQVDITGDGLDNGRRGDLKSDPLATLCHKRKRALTFPLPIPSHIRVCKMVVSNGLDLDNIDQFAKSSGTYYFSYLPAVR